MSLIDAPVRGFYKYLAGCKHYLKLSKKSTEFFSQIQNILMDLLLHDFLKTVDTVHSIGLGIYI